MSTAVKSAIRRRRKWMISAAVSFLAASPFITGFYVFTHRMNIDACSGNLHQIGLAILLYANANDHNYPDTFAHLLAAQPLNAYGMICPASGDTPASGPIDFTTGGHLSYIYVGQGLTDTSASVATVVAFEPLANHITGMNVLFGDGHVEFVERKRGQFIAQQAAMQNRPILLPPWYFPP